MLRRKNQFKAFKMPNWEISTVNLEAGYGYKIYLPCKYNIYISNFIVTT